MQVKKSYEKVYFLSFGLKTSSREYPISVKLTATSPIIKPRKRFTNKKSAQRFDGVPQEVIAVPFVLVAQLLA